jgi:hypothetical protein
MQTVTTIGLEIAKSVFQVHAVDAAGKVMIRRQLKRRYVLAFFEKLPPCLIGIEACASSHHFFDGLRICGAKIGAMAKQKQPPGSPMTLGNMRELGVRRLIASCSSPGRNSTFARPRC